MPYIILIVTLLTYLLLNVWLFFATFITLTLLLGFEDYSNQEKTIDLPQDHHENLSQAVIYLGYIGLW